MSALRGLATAGAHGKLKPIRLGVLSALHAASPHSRQTASACSIAVTTASACWSGAASRPTLLIRVSMGTPRASATAAAAVVTDLCGHALPTSLPTLYDVTQSLPGSRCHAGGECRTASWMTSQPAARPPTDWPMRRREDLRDAQHHENHRLTIR